MLMYHLDEWLLLVAMFSACFRESREGTRDVFPYVTKAMIPVKSCCLSSAHFAIYRSRLAKRRSMSRCPLPGCSRHTHVGTPNDRFFRQIKSYATDGIYLMGIKGPLHGQGSPVF